MRPDRKPKPTRAPLPSQAGDSYAAVERRLRQTIARNSQAQEAGALHQSREVDPELETERVDQTEVDGRLQRRVPIPGQPGRRATMAVSRQRRRPDPVPRDPQRPAATAPEAAAAPQVAQAPEAELHRFPTIEPSVAADFGPEGPPADHEQPVSEAFDDAYSEAPTFKEPARPVLDEDAEVIPFPNRQAASIYVSSEYRTPAPPATLVPENTDDAIVRRVQDPDALFPDVSVTPVETAEAETDPVVTYDRAAAEAAYDQSGREGVYGMSATELPNRFDTSSGREVRARSERHIPHESARVQLNEDANMARAQARIDTTVQKNAFDELDPVSEQRIDAILGVFESLNKNASRQRTHYESLSAWRNPMQKLEAWNMLRQTRQQITRYERTYPDVYRDFRSGRRSQNQAKRAAYRQLPQQDKKRAA